MQTVVPAAVLAQASALDLLGSETGKPVGYALVGPIGVAVGLHSFLTASAAIAWAAFTLSPSIRKRTETVGASQKARPRRTAGSTLILRRHNSAGLDTRTRQAGRRLRCRFSAIVSDEPPCAHF